MAHQYGEGLYALLANLSKWQSVDTFVDALDTYFQGPRTTKEIEDYRAARGPLKKLSSEVVPVARHLRFRGFSGDVRFSMSDSFPDAWLRMPDGQEQGVEVTVAQAREKYELAAELNRTGEGRGFLGLADTASREAFDHHLKRPRIMYTSESALKVIGAGIIRCIEKKNRSKYAGCDLLIEAPLRSLSSHHWAQITNQLREATEGSPFREIHVIGNADQKPFGFQLK